MLTGGVAGVQGLVAGLGGSPGSSSSGVAAAAGGLFAGAFNFGTALPAAGSLNMGFVAGPASGAGAAWAGVHPATTAGLLPQRELQEQALQQVQQQYGMGTAHSGYVLGGTSTPGMLAAVTDSTIDEEVLQGLQPAGVPELTDDEVLQLLSYFSS